MKNTKREVGTIKKRRLKIRIQQHWQLYLFLLPAVVYLAVFHYAPLYGLQAAFRDFKPRLGYWGSPWVGFEHFERFFTSNSFWTIVPNTIILSIYSLIISFPLAILLAVCLNYIPSLKFKKVVQNVTYAPHFISMVVIVNLITIFFGYSDGFVNNILESFGMDRILFLGEENLFRHVYIWTSVWQNTGWNSIIYIAALAGVDASLHEAAKIDGASIWKRIWHIDLPAILPTMVTLLILNAGKIMSVGFDKAYLMQNDLNIGASEIISTYVYKQGLLRTQYGYAAAVDVFNAVINLALLLLANQISKKVNDSGIF